MPLTEAEWGQINTAILTMEGVNVAGRGTYVHADNLIILLSKFAQDGQVQLFAELAAPAKPEEMAQEAEGEAEPKKRWAWLRGGGGAK